MTKSRASADMFPKRLRDAMELRGLNQADFAKRSGLQTSAISHFATGGRKPSFDNLRRLADALDVTTDFLLGRAKEPSGHARADQLFRNLERLTTEDRELAEKIVKDMAERGAGRRKKGDS